MKYLTPFLVALYPIIFLYAQNSERIPFPWILRSILAVIAFTLFLTIFLFVGIRNRLNTLFVASIFMFILLTFNRFTGFIPHFELIRFGNLAIGKNTVLITITLLLLGGIFYWSRKTKAHIAPWLMVIFSTSSMLVLLNTGRVIYTTSTSRVRPKTSHESTSHTGAPLKHMPDVYYIILDMHGRADVLEDAYGYSDDLFVPTLMDMGFYVASQSSTNYPTTYESIASSLNMDYLDTLTGDYRPDVRTLVSLVEESAVATHFKRLGYSYILFDSGYAVSNTSPRADELITYTFGLNRFEQLLLQTTIFSHLVNKLPVDMADDHRARILYFFDQLTHIPDDDRPTFTFAHLVVPHWPFVFDAHGDPVPESTRFSLDDYSDISESDHDEQYVQQLIFTDKKMLDVVSAILSRSETPPIIIIQSDHGPSFGVDWDVYYSLVETNQSFETIAETELYKRTGILNAYYFPDGNYQSLRSTITPVNSFRTVLNQYFQGSYETIEDIPMSSLP